MDYLCYIFSNSTTYKIYLSNSDFSTIPYTHISQKIEQLFFRNNKKSFYVKSEYHISTYQLNELIVELNDKYPDVNIKIIKNTILYGVLLKFENLIPLQTARPPPYILNTSSTEENK